jgi:hypothetical protein
LTVWRGGVRIETVTRAWPEILCWMLGLGAAVIFTYFAARDTYLIPLTPRSALSAEDGHVSLLFDPTASPKFTGGLVTLRDVTQYGIRGPIVYGIGKPPPPPEIRDGMTGKVIDQKKPRFDPTTPVWFILDTGGNWNNPAAFTDETAWLSRLKELSITPDRRTPTFLQADPRSISQVAWIGLVAITIVAILAIMRVRQVLFPAKQRATPASEAEPGKQQ